MVIATIVVIVCFTEFILVVPTLLACWANEGSITLTAAKEVYWHRNLPRSVRFA